MSGIRGLRRVRCQRSRHNLTQRQTKMDDAAVLFLIDLQRKNGAYQLRDYVERLRRDINVVVHESSLCRIFQKLGLTIKKPDIVRLERFCRQGGELGGGTRSFLLQRLILCVSNPLRAHILSPRRYAGPREGAVLRGLPEHHHADPGGQPGRLR